MKPKDHVAEQQRALNRNTIFKSALRVTGSEKCTIYVLYLDFLALIEQ